MILSVQPIIAPLFRPVVPYSISSYVLPHELCTKVHVALALDEPGYTPYDPHVLYNVLDVS